MLKAIFTNRYVIAGIIVFVFLFILGMYLEFSVIESLLASAVLSAVGVVAVWWEEWW
jgi:hypothetical protein